MMSPRTSFLVWWGLPILCGGFGAFLAAFAGEGGDFGHGPGQIGPLMLIGAYFTLVALLALIFRVRQNQVSYGARDRYDKPMEAAMVALCVPILAAGLWMFASNFKADFGRSHVVSGKLVSIDRIGAFGQTYGFDLDKTATPLMLECYLRSSCGSPTPLLALKPGTPMELELLNSKVIGLKANGRVLVSSGPQRFWRLLAGGGALALLVIYSAGFVATSMRLLFSQPEEQDTPSFWPTT